jgi:hypothetical protein
MRSVCRGRQDHIKKSIIAGGVAQAVECLPSKLEAMSSNPNTAKKKQTKKTLKCRSKYQFTETKENK